MLRKMIKAVLFFMVLNCYAITKSEMEELVGREVSQEEYEYWTETDQCLLIGDWEEENAKIEALINKEE
jgi:hypothetical protein